MVQKDVGDSSIRRSPRLNRTSSSPPGVSTRRCSSAEPPNITQRATRSRRPSSAEGSNILKESTQSSKTANISEKNVAVSDKEIEQEERKSSCKQSVKFKENEEIGRRITRSMKSSASDLLKEEEKLTTKEEETLALKDNDGLTPIEEGDEEESAEASNADDKAMNGTDKNETLLDNELIKTVRDAKFIVKNCLSLLEKENIQPKSQVTSNATGSSSENDKETAVTVVSDLKMQSSADETQKVKETSTNKTNAIVNGTNQDSDEEVDVCSNSIDRTIKIDESEIKQEKEEEIKQEQKEEMKPKKEEEMKPKKEEEMKQEKEETPRVEKLNSKKDIINFKINMLLSEISIPSGSEEDEEKRHPLLDSMAEEGEEDTPSEGSNDIVEIGEEINTTESEFSSDESYDKNSFIDDEENCQLLSGEEYDLSLEDSHKRRRIIKLSSGSDDEVVRISKPKKKIPKKRKKSRIIRIQDSSDEDEDRHDLVIDVEEQQIKQDCEERSKNETEGDNDDITMETITVQTRGEGDQKVNLDVLVPCDKKPEEDNTFNEKVETFDRVSASSGTFEDEKPEENNTFHGNVEERGCISSPFVDPKNKIEQENILPSEDVVFGNVEQVSSLSTRVDNNKVENKETVNYKDAEDSEQNPFVEIVDNSIATGDDSWKDRHLNEKIIILENIRVQDIRNKSLSDDINNLLNTFCSELISRNFVGKPTSTTTTNKQNLNVSVDQTPEVREKCDDIEAQKKETLGFNNICYPKNGKKKKKWRKKSKKIIPAVKKLVETNFRELTVEKSTASASGQSLEEDGLKSTVEKPVVNNVSSDNSRKRKFSNVDGSESVGKKRKKQQLRPKERPYENLKIGIVEEIAMSSRNMKLLETNATFDREWSWKSVKKSTQHNTVKKPTQINVIVKKATQTNGGVKKPTQNNGVKVNTSKSGQSKNSNSTQFHVKDFKNAMLYDSSRIRRTDTKQMLKKKMY
jgi:hypothetical protein